MQSTSRPPSPDCRCASPFETYLRTGRRVRAVELKFNPWHDPDNGRFTHAWTGNYFGRGGGRSDTPNYNLFNPRHPNNHTIYVVRHGDTLTGIAKLRNGLTTPDLAWLNNLRNANSLRVGQRLMVPNQAYLDEGRRARANFINLFFYMETHGGRLPPNVAKVPSIEEQLNSNWRRERANDYSFYIDVLERQRRIRAELTLSPAPRSKRSQAQAGGADRRATDHGGHFIAARFNGPHNPFNHFAQDASFNRTKYLALENRWAKELKAGRRVFVDIIPHYEGLSTRPSHLTVIWFVDGQRYRDEFPNEPEGK